MRIRLFILTGFVLAGCNLEPNKGIRNKINGTWKLTKVVTTHRTFDTLGGSREYAFRNDGTYDFSSYLNDIKVEDKGYYEIADKYYLKSGIFLILKGKVNPTLMEILSDNIQCSKF